ncbi:low affinity iron transporter, putative [Talaromyces stipitatus ATCC 10500]|uniref:Low affinity iron transporter, putative n=1 Tax=Talaromyces stipitatus (strain ATCC 10500 / CBS 375.48 / QM 6759 / NRRL 1006) TaxID=441959 RepID=B8LW38_TALSN|nr:low affinity iron transporter, putative [Talaromyces stipitatus ATCC 10500]EED24066.1 low affinity iron transporter, putative [Talaromyces stipitatus ATCC 10500]
MMDRLVRLLRKPGSKDAVEGIAPTQRIKREEEEGSENITIYVMTPKRAILDRWLDWVVRASGSKFVFCAILAGLLTWALLGIPYGRTDTWQVIISDVQAIICYVFDSFLVRQQLNEYDNEIRAAAQVQSRLISHARMLNALKKEINEQRSVHGAFENSPLDIQERETALPEDTKFGRAIGLCARILGHLVTSILFWAGVIIWIGVGTLRNWSNDWQLYMNSASSALMVFVFSFLANIHERHSTYMKRCLDAIFCVDSRLELKLRELTDDNLQNQPVVIPPPRVNWIQRTIFYYADFVGTLAGIAILLTVVAIWVAVGPILKFNANWWLLIGTYAGLIGMNDAFVLRNMQARLSGYVDAEHEKIDKEDERLFNSIRLEIPTGKEHADNSLSSRVSRVMCRISAHELTVVAGFLLLVGLVIGASVMRWSLTGQLLCNVPPSIIESFFMIILIAGHNEEESRKVAELQSMYERRLRLLSFVKRFEALRDSSAHPPQKLAVDSTFLRSVSREYEYLPSSIAFASDLRKRGRRLSVGHDSTVPTSD